MKAYLDILLEVLRDGSTKPNRTGIDTISVSGVQFKHDMRNGFPLLTTKKMGLKNIAKELQFFISGSSDKRVLQEMGNHTWDPWCNPEKVRYGHDKRTQLEMKECYDLGRIYGVQWRDWQTLVEDSNYLGHTSTIGIDQLMNLINTLKENPLDRRMIVTAWNPGELDQMALPPCHYAFQCLSDGTYLDLIWIQRSCDMPLGIPYDIGLYGLLLLLLAKTSKLIPRFLIGQLGDVHIYTNQISMIEEQLTRRPKILPEVNIGLKEGGNIFEWKYSDIELIKYESHPAIKIPIAI